MQLYVAREGKRIGPFSDSQVREMVDGGLLSRSDLAWTQGRADWLPLVDILEFEEPPNPPPAAPQFSRERSSGDTKLQGVGGWLLFFCVALTILGPLLSVGQMLQGWESSKPAFQAAPQLRTVLIFENLFLSLIMAYGFYVGVTIWSGSPSGRSLAKKYLWIRLATMIVGEVIAFQMLSEIPTMTFDILAEAFLGKFMAEGLFFGIWYLYFSRSKRAKITYGEA